MAARAGGEDRGEGVVEKDELAILSCLCPPRLKRQKWLEAEKMFIEVQVNGPGPGECHEPRVDGGDLEKDQLGFSAPPFPPPLLGS